MTPRKRLIAMTVVGVILLVASVVVVTYGQEHSGKIDLLTGQSLYQVTFLQLPTCGGDSGWGEPWAVTLDGQTKSQPPNTSIIHDGATLYGTQDKSISTIAFSVASGTHLYKISPPDLFNGSLGTVVVGHAAVIIRTIEITQCPLVATATTSSAQK
jgi:hypothetical protein